MQYLKLGTVINRGGLFWSVSCAALCWLGSEVTTFAAGTLTAWGDNSFNQGTPPANATNFVAFSAGAFHNLAVKADHTVVAWGQNSLGQTNVPTGLSGVTAVAAGWNFSVALRTEGTIAAWGWSVVRQTTFPTNINNATAIAAGYDHAILLKEDGTVLTWGSNAYGQTNTPTGLTNVLEIAGGGWHSLALRRDGTVAMWGDNSAGQRVMPPGLTDIVAIAGGGFHSLALRRNGTVVAWGTNDFGQLNVPPNLSNVVAIAAGQYHSLALKRDGTLVGWGRNVDGQIPPEASNVGAISGGIAHTLALTGAKVKILRVLVAQANSGDSLVLEPTTYYDNVVINKNLSLRGAGIGQTILDANMADSALVIQSNATVDVRDVTIVNAVLVRLVGHESQPFVVTRGPGVLNNGALSILDCEILNCPGRGLENAGQLEMRRCTIANRDPLDSEGFRFYRLGPGIRNSGAGRITDCTITNCVVLGLGGAVDNTGSLAMTNCALSGTAWQMSFVGFSGYGGCIHNVGQLTLNYCNISGSATDGGGVIFSSSNLVALNSTIESSRGQYQGAVFLLGVGTSFFSGCTIRNNFVTGIENYGQMLTLANCTVTGNGMPSEDGGNRSGPGILSSGPTFLSHCTIVSNIASGVVGEFVTARNCIIQDVGPTLTSEGYNLIQNTNGMTLAGSSIGNLYGVDPRLGPLQDNGGPTLTHALLPGSPAIDAGSSQGSSTDQRGYARPWDIAGIGNRDDGGDIGAFEYVVAPGTLYVNASNSTPIPPYATWETAATRVQFALDLVADGGRIRVGSGTYPERIDFRGKTIVVSSEAGPGATTLDGAEGGSVVRFVAGEGPSTVLDGFQIINGYATNGGGIYCSNASPIITNCIIANNRSFSGTSSIPPNLGDPNFPPHGGDGGGIYATEDSRPTILSCVISNNVAGNGGSGGCFWPWPGPCYPAGDGGNGGGIACAKATIVQCTVISNWSGGGGGTYGDGTMGRGGHGGGIFCRDATIADCLFRGNTSGAGGEPLTRAFPPAGNGGWGGAIACLSSAIIERCFFLDNSTGRGGGSEYAGGDGGHGGALAALGSSAQIRSCIFFRNTTGNGGSSVDVGGAGGSGGGIYAADRCFISDCQFKTNATGDGGYASGIYHAAFGGDGGNGGAVHFRSGTMTTCLIEDNRTGDGGAASSRGSVGGAGGDGAGVFTGAGVVTSCLVVNNRTGNGGTGYFSASGGRGGNGSGCSAIDSSIINCTFSGNDLGLGGGVTNQFGAIGSPGTAAIVGGLWCTNTTIFNSIIWNNAGREIEGHDFTVDFSDIEGGSVEPWFNPANCLDVDPQFVDAAIGNWRVRPSSPCIDVGTNMTLLVTALDLDGNPRVVNGRPDLGAYESSAGPVGLLATHRAELYVSPGTVAVRCQFSYPAGRHLLSLLWQPTLPAGWNVLSVSGDSNPVLAFGEIIVSGSLSGSPLNLTYIVAVPAGQSGVKEIRGTVQYQLDGMINPAEFSPMPVSLSVSPTHTSDYRDSRGQIDGSEANRVLAYWRAQAYQPAATGLDGYAPGSGSTSGPRHMADYRSPFWVIDATEVNRVLSYWRAGCYQANAAGLDGYAPGCDAIASGALAIGAAGAAPMLTATQSGPHVYRPGGIITVTNRLVYSGSMLSFLARPALPSGWTLLSVAGDGSPEIIAGEIVFTSATIPASPAQLIYTAVVPSTDRGCRQLRTELECHFRDQANPQSYASTPELLSTYWQPTLTVARRERVLLVSWPTGDDQFVLEASPNLMTAAEWHPVDVMPVTLDGQVTVAIPIEPIAPTQFYRLRRP